MQKQEITKEGEGAKEVIKHIRPLNAVMVFIICVLGSFLAGAPFETIFPSALSAFLISGASQSINDYFDYEIDALKGRKHIPKQKLLLLSAILYTSGILVAAFTSVLHFISAFAISTLTFAYSWKLSGMKYLGNVLVSFCVAFSLIYGGLSGDVQKTVLPSLMMFLANWSREIIKDLEDYSVDKGYKTTLPHLVGKKISKTISVFPMLVAVVLSPLLLPPPVGLGIFDWDFLYLYVPASLFFIISSAYSLRGNYKEAQRVCKVAMLLALGAYVLGIF